jgi:hypothetical protein
MEGGTAALYHIIAENAVGASNENRIFFIMGVKKAHQNKSRGHGT